MALNIYLDQSRWVELLHAREGTGRSRPGASEALQALEAAVGLGEAVVPLSAAHYHETWHRHAWRKRYDLARLLRDISKWKTMAPIQAVTEFEIEALLQPEVSPPPVKRVFGEGVNHAFDSPTGRLVLVDELPGPLYPTPQSEGLTDEMRQLQLEPARWEWANLAGPALDFPLEGLPGGAAFAARDEHARGDDWVRSELELREWVDGAGLSNKLREVLVLQDVETILPLFRRVLRRGVSDPQRISIADGQAAQRLHRSLRCREVLVDLTYYRLSERQYTPHQHDRLDLLAHAVAFTYCDVVVTENRLADLARRARVAEHHGTLVLTDLGDLPTALASAQ